MCLCLSWPTSGLLTPMAAVPGNLAAVSYPCEGLTPIPVMSIWSEAVNTRTHMLVLAIH